MNNKEEEITVRIIQLAMRLSARCVTISSNQPGIDIARLQSLRGQLSAPISPNLSTFGVLNTVAPAMETFALADRYITDTRSMMADYSNAQGLFERAITILHSRMMRIKKRNDLRL